MSEERQNSYESNECKLICYELTAITVRRQEFVQLWNESERK